jgi:hypothetical protein
LKIERKLPGAQSQTVFQIEIDLELARKFAKSQTVKELIANIDRAEREGRPGKYNYFLGELGLMLSFPVTVRLEGDKYVFTYGESVKFLPLERLGKVEVLNVLLRLCPNP